MDGKCTFPHWEEALLHLTTSHLTKILPWFLTLLSHLLLTYLITPFSFPFYFTFTLLPTHLSPPSQSLTTYVTYLLPFPLMLLSSSPAIFVTPSPFAPHHSSKPTYSPLSLLLNFVPLFSLFNLQILTFFTYFAPSSKENVARDSGNDNVEIISSEKVQVRTFLRI